MTLINIIGVDCAAQPGKHRSRLDETGRRHSRRPGGASRLERGLRCLARREVDPRIASPTARARCSARLTCRARPSARRPPRAGEPLRPTAHVMFRRPTDNEICERLGRRSLEVAADRIARATHAALCFLEDLRALVGHPLPLVWSPTWRGPIWPDRGLPDWHAPGAPRSQRIRISERAEYASEL
jgi:hypothetical protein